MKKMPWQFWMALAGMISSFIVGLVTTLGTYYNLDKKVDVQSSVQTAKIDAVNDKMTALQASITRIEGVIIYDKKQTVKNRKEDCRPIEPGICIAQKETGLQNH